jgi:hypothetical protein
MDTKVANGGNKQTTNMPPSSSVHLRIREMVRLPVESDKTRQQVRTAGALAGHFETVAGRRHDGRSTPLETPTTLCSIQGRICLKVKLKIMI